MRSNREKQTMKKIVFRFFVSLLFSIFYFLFSSTAFAAERIEAFSSHITINQNGSFNVQEEIAYDFGDTEHHGIYREIPLIYTPVGSKYENKMDVSSISVTDGHGNLRQTSYDNGGNSVTLKIGDPDELVTGQQFYVIHYTVWGGLTAGLTKDELYWNVTGNGWKVPIDHVRADVVLPTSILNDKVSFACYAGVFGTKDSCQSTSTESTATGTVSTVRFEQRGLHGAEGLTIAVGFPKGLILFTQAPEEQKKTYAANGGVVKWWQKPFLDISLAIPVVVFAIMINLWWSRGRDPRGRGTIIPEYDIPNGLSVLSASALYHGRVDSKAISATIISLAINGYLKIRRIEEKVLFFDSADYRLTMLKPSDDLPPSEKMLHDALFGNLALTALEKEITDGVLSVAKAMGGVIKNDKKVGDTGSVLLSELKGKLAEVSSRLESLTEEQLTMSGYYVTDPRKTKMTYTIAGFVIMMVSFFIPGINLAAILSGLIIFCFGFIMPKMTEEGVLTKEELEGFKRYLSVAEADRIKFANAPEKNPKMFEKFLPYAMIFGVEKAWAKQFEGLYQQPNSQKGWYSGGSAVFTGAAFANEMESFSSGAASAVSTGGGGASSGGGFSGGGAGGGGGGSW